MPITEGRIVGQFTEGSTVFGLVSGLTVVRSPVTAPPGPLTIARSGADVTLSWPGSAMLQAASVINGPWADVVGATSPYPITPAQAQQFYRLKR